ncbi:MAG TPA: Fe-S cluster assembly protein SufD [Candidatus Binatia bacterium]
MASTETKEHYLDAFRERRSRGSAPNPPWLNKLREEAMASFASLGFPTVKAEEWKYTNLEPITALKFSPPNGARKRIAPSDLLAKAFADPDCVRLVFFNGVYARELASLERLPEEVRLQSLAELINEDDEFLATQLGRYAGYGRQSLVALNTAFIGDGAVLIVPPGRRLAEPIHLIYASGADGEQPVTHPRTLIFLGRGSEAKIIENYIGITGGSYFCNAVTELVAEADSIVEHCRVQRESDAGFHTGTVEARLARGAHLTAHAVTLAGSLVRNDVHVSLDGEGAECVLNGLYLGSGRQHIDNSTVIEHVKPRASSFELYKGILNDAAHGVFNGKIVVHKDAQKSDARQVNKNLLLSDDAVVNTKPQLEIHADDVKCSHGSTIGQIDPDALFYFRSRGLGLAEARRLLSAAFAADVVGRIKVASLRQRLDEYILEKFREI